MTIIAWDGRTLAADKRITNSGLARTVTKIFRLNDSLVGMWGEMSLCLEVVEWLRAGADPAKMPTAQRNADDWSVVAVFDRAGVRVYERSPCPITYEDDIWASGSGRDYAIAAMHLGKSAREAVEIACLFDVNCGNGIDTLELEP